MWRFIHSELKDVELVQLSLNPEGDAATSWSIAWERIERAMADLSVPLLGRTLVYQAVLPEEAEADDVVATLLRERRLRAADGRVFRRVRTGSSVSGGCLWLLATPSGGKDTVYLALGPGPAEQQKKLTRGVLFGPRATLVWPDTVAHKAYSMARDYLTSGARKDFRDATDALMDQTVAILRQKDLSNASLLDDLGGRVANLATVMAELRRLHSALEIHQTNYKLSLEGSGFSGPVAEYHRQQIDNRLTRIDHDLKDANAALEAANIAIRSLRAKYERLQAEEAKKQTQIEKQRAEQEAQAALKQIQIEKQRAEQEAQAALKQELWEKERAEREAHAHRLTQTILAVLALALAVGRLVSNDFWLIYWQALVILGTGAAIGLLVRWLAYLYGPRQLPNPDRASSGELPAPTTAASNVLAEGTTTMPNDLAVPSAATPVEDS